MTNPFSGDPAVSGGRKKSKSAGKKYSCEGRSRTREFSATEFFLARLDFPRLH